jgi:hypothetical protein
MFHLGKTSSIGYFNTEDEAGAAASFAHANKKALIEAAALMPDLPSKNRFLRAACAAKTIHPWMADADSDAIRPVPKKQCFSHGESSSSSSRSVV